MSLDITKNGTTNVHFEGHICKQTSGADAQSPEGATIGLLSSLNLTATYTARTYQNGEGHIFVRDAGLHKKEKSGRGGKTGERVQDGLTNRGKRSIRILTGAYAKEFTGVRFITLSFRNIIPEFAETKRMLDNFLKRLRRIHPDAHYFWVAELQKRGAIHFHLMTPESLAERLPGESAGRFKKREKEWLNDAWNDVVMSRLERIGAITAAQREEWAAEYQEYAENYRNGVKGATGKGKYYLTPNIKYAADPAVVGCYMAKYMSKNESKTGKKLKGNIWNISQASREFLKSEDKVVAPVGMHEDPAAVLEAVAKEARKAGINVFLIDIFAGRKILWSSDIEGVIDLWRKRQAAIYSEAIIANSQEAQMIERERYRRSALIRPPRDAEQLLTAEMWGE